MRLIPLLCLILTLASCGGSPVETKLELKSVQTGPSYNGFSEAEVLKIFSSCKVCHGKDGKKMFGGASDLSASEMNLNERVTIIKYGKGKMLPYEGRLNDEEIRAVAEYIETFRE